MVAAPRQSYVIGTAEGRTKYLRGQPTIHPSHVLMMVDGGHSVRIDLNLNLKSRRVELQRRGLRSITIRNIIIA